MKRCIFSKNYCIRLVWCDKAQVTAFVQNLAKVLPCGAVLFSILGFEKLSDSVLNACKLDLIQSPANAKKIQQNTSIDSYFKVIAGDSKSVAERRGGSSPPTAGTKLKRASDLLKLFFFAFNKVSR